jgi:predicted metal-dependent enzyme (double-stranded beta helix superfamily)
VADSANWRHLVHHEDRKRVYEQIFADEHVNAWLICWSESQDTGFHDHDDSAGGIAVISGRVQEERLVLGAEPQVRRFASPGRFTVPASAIHRVLHIGEEPAVTIHAYSPPLRRMGAYSIGSDGSLERTPLTYEQELRAA